MPLTFDATLKDLARAHPQGFVAAFDRPTTLPLSLLNVDLSAVTTAADFIVGLGDPLREVLHLDFQASAKADKHLDILVYNALLHRRYRIPVHSVVILLRPQAAHSNVNGTVNYAARPDRGKMEFGYEIVRIWEIPAETFLAGDIGTVPLAPLGRLPADLPLTRALGDVIRRLVDRLIREAPAERTRELLTTSYLLSGLRIQQKLARQLFQGVPAMQESSTYMAILEEGEEKGRRKGRAEEAKRLILRQGTKRFGPAGEAVEKKLEEVTDINRLEALAERLLDVSSWDELFA